MASKIELPALPCLVKDFVQHVKKNPQDSIRDLLTPFQAFDAKARQVYAQQPDDPVLQDELLNVAPLFGTAEHGLKVRARNLTSESKEEKEQYIMPLKSAQRKANDSPAIVGSIKEFLDNFNIFTELSLTELKWDNVIVAGSAVVCALLPVPAEHAKSKRTMRKYYHETFAPASDVDLFLYGLDEEQAIEKIKQIEQNIRDSILHETTTIRTRNTITIVSQYPTRHVQIVLRVYKSISEILTGFDVDCSGVAFDGKQVYAAPRAIAAYMTQINTIDLSRRSPSYENRLSKYSHRGFEVHWPHLERSRIDPTIFEQSFRRTEGLARLLVLEGLPTSESREAYVVKRRSERGRPQRNAYMYRRRQLGGDVKKDHEDEVAEWVIEDAVSDYHTFTIPYGQRWTAKKIEKVLYTKDLLLNAEWNKPKDRDVHLHRHPAFFGLFDDVIDDCCGCCPVPQTPEEKEIAEEESKRYVSGRVSILKDDPGRQAIGSFNPLTNDDWTDMAYVSNTELLCRAIVGKDLEAVKRWLEENDNNANHRDYTGRTPLQLAVMSSSTEIVQCLVDAGARMVARMVDGQTALHIAAAHGRLDVVKLLLIRSEANEAEEQEKADAKRAAAKESSSSGAADTEDSESFEEITDDLARSDIDVQSQTTGSFVKVDKKPEDAEAVLLDGGTDEPDVFDVNIPAWDSPVSALHLAVMNGHVEIVKELVSTFGADILLPVKNLGWNGEPQGVMMTMCLVLRSLPLDKAKLMASKLLELGATSTQANPDHHTVLQYYAKGYPELLQVLLDEDALAVKRLINVVTMAGNHWRAVANTPLLTAIHAGSHEAAQKLLDFGAKPTIDESDFIKAFAKFNQDKQRHQASDAAVQSFLRDCTQPLALAIAQELPLLAIELLRKGADANTLTEDGQQSLYQGYSYKAVGGTVLDHVRNQLEDLNAEKSFIRENLDFMAKNNGLDPSSKPNDPFVLGSDESYLKDYKQGSYQHWHIQTQLDHERNAYKLRLEAWEQNHNNVSPACYEEKSRLLKELLKNFELLEKELLRRGAKPFEKLHPGKTTSQKQKHQRSHRYNEPDFKASLKFAKNNLTAEETDGHAKVFNAAWNGDLETIKRYTLGRWGQDNGQAPLELAVPDAHGLNPFIIACLRGHNDVAQGIMKIIKAQYKPKDSTNPDKRYELQGEEGDEYDSAEDDDSDHEASESGQARLSSRIVTSNFTIDNIGEIANEVQSHRKPHDVIENTITCDLTSQTAALLLGSGLSRKLQDAATAVLENVETEEVANYKRVIWPHSLLAVATLLDDHELFDWLLKHYVDYAKEVLGEDMKVDDIEDVQKRLFNYALELGKVDVIDKLIQLFGAGLPLEKLAKSSSSDAPTKSKYYSGLTVYGKKRPEWAKKPVTDYRHMTSNVQQLPPILAAARAGSAASFEYFSSERPLKSYLKFATTRGTWSVVKQLKKSEDGFENTVTKYLESQAHLSLHAAVLSGSNSGKYTIMERILEQDPAAIDDRTGPGYTALHLAFRKYNVKAVKILLKHGANQLCRDKQSLNILHHLLGNSSNFLYQDSAKFEALLDIIDKDVIAKLFVQRSSVASDSETPLHWWLMHYAFTNESDYCVKALNSLLDRSECVEVDLIRGAGNTPMHDIVARRRVDLLKALAAHRPGLIYRENSTGRTSADILFDARTQHNCQDHERLNEIGNHYGRVRGIVSQSIQDFGPKEPSKEELWEEAWREVVEAAPKERKLVTLAEANEVAKRLAAKEAGDDSDEAVPLTTNNNRRRGIFGLRNRHVGTWSRGQGQGQEQEETDVLSPFY